MNNLLNRKWKPYQKSNSSEKNYTSKINLNGQGMYNIPCSTCNVHLTSKQNFIYIYS